MSKTASKTAVSAALSTISAEEVARVLGVSQIFTHTPEFGSSTEEFTFRCFKSYDREEHNHWGELELARTFRTCFFNEVQVDCIEKGWSFARGPLTPVGGFPCDDKNFFLGKVQRGVVTPSLKNIDEKANYYLGYWAWVRASRMAGEAGNWTARVHVTHTHYTEKVGDTEIKGLSTAIDRIWWEDAEGGQHDVARVFTKEEVEAAKGKDAKTIKAAIAKLAPWSKCYHRHGDTYFAYAFMSKK